MNKFGFTIGVFSIAVIVAGIFALKAINPTPVSKASSTPFAGMAEWRRFEVEQESIPVTGAQVSGDRPVGMGDLHRFEGQEVIPNTGAPASHSQQLGMGDLRRFEAQPSVAEPAGQARGNLPAGMGDLHRLESQQGGQSTP